MTYRAILPAKLAANEKLPVLYLLHGGGGGFRDWSNYSNVSQFAERKWILIMPEGESSYYVNSAGKLQDRFEDYIVHDLLSDVESRFPAAAGREDRAIVGVSMGGFGAINLALRHPTLFSFAGGLSPALDVPSRPFSLKRLSQSRRFESIFGSSGSQTRRENNPFVLVRSADPEKTPYLFLSCGEQEGLLAPNREFAALLAERHFHYEYHVVPGDHTWTQWSGRLPDLLISLSQHWKPHS